MVERFREVLAWGRDPSASSGGRELGRCDVMFRRQGLIAVVTLAVSAAACGNGGVETLAFQGEVPTESALVGASGSFDLDASLLDVDDVDTEWELQYRKVEEWDQEVSAPESCGSIDTLLDLGFSGGTAAWRNLYSDGSFEMLNHSVAHRSAEWADRSVEAVLAWPSCDNYEETARVIHLAEPVGDSPEVIVVEAESNSGRLLVGMIRRGSTVSILMALPNPDTEEFLDLTDRAAELLGAADESPTG